MQALSEVSFSIRKGEIYGLIGPNGAGKTTLFNVLTGIYAARRRRLHASTARSLAGLKAHQVAAAGIGRTFQNIRLFVNLSALENVMIGRHARTHAGVLGAILRNRKTLEEEKAIEKRALELLDYVGIRARANDAAGSLPYGDQRRLEIARALATEPKLLALDEPAAGMNPSERLALGKLIRRIRDDGVTRAADRARCAPGDERLRPRDGARLRREDRRRHAGRSAEGPEGHRGLPGSAA